MSIAARHYDTVTAPIITEKTTIGGAAQLVKA